MMNSSASSSSVNSGGGSGGTADGGDGSDTASGGGGGGGGTGSEIDRGGSFVTSNSTSMINKSFVLRKPTQTGNMQHSTDLHPTTDEHIYKMAPEAVDPAILSRGSLSLRRYTRSALLILRDDALSKVRPECTNDPRLSNLGFWRLPDSSSTLSYSSTSNSHGTGGGISVSGKSSGVGGNSSSGNSGGGVNNSGGGRILFGVSNSNAGGNSKSVMDHRSISSSHLMPAFMKRRAVIPSASTLSNNNSSSGGGGVGGSPMLQSNEASKDSSISQRHRKDSQHQQMSQQDIILSPQRKSINMGCQMPASASNQYPDRDLQTSLRERRIGSGRLPPRDVNWDYRPEKEAMTAVNNENENYNNSGPARLSGSQNIGSYRNIPGGSGNSGQEFREHRFDRRSFGRNNSGSGGDYLERDNRDGSNNNVRRFISSLAGNSSGGHGAGHGYSGNERRSKQYNDSRCDEPEWLNAGPISQDDTIELRGFDEAEDMPNYHHYEKEDNTHGYKSYKSGASNSNHNQSSLGKETHSLKDGAREVENDDPHPATNHQTPPPARSTPTKNAHDTNNNMNNNVPSQPSESSDSHSSTVGERNQNSEDRDSKHINLNFDEILKMESLNDILAGDNNNRKSGSSRFSQWFKHSSPTNQTNMGRHSDSRRSSLHEELNNMINVESNQQPYLGMAGGTASHPQQQQRIHTTQNQLHPDNSGDKYFVPISPAAGANSRQQSSTNHPLLDFLLKNNLLGQNTQAIPGAGIPSSGGAAAIPSVEELEARMRKNEPLGDAVGFQQPSQNQFNKLSSNVAPVTHHPNHSQQPQTGQQGLVGHQNHSSPPPQPQEIEIFKKIINALQQQQHQQQQQQQQQHQQQHLLIQQMLLGRAQQQQQRSMQQQFHAQQQQLLQKFMQINNNSQVNRNDLNKLPEAQSIIQGIARGEITQNSLLQQLASTSVSVRDREIIISVLNHFTQQQQHSNTSPVRPVISPSTTIQQQLQLQQHLTKNCNNNSTGLSVAGNNCGNGNTTSSDNCGNNNSTIGNGGGGGNVANAGSTATSNLLCSPAQKAPPAIVHQPPPTAQSSNDILQSHLLFQQQTQKSLRLSPLPNGLPQRIPSPRELQFHTQSIMQNALIKKKLEEQQENYRRRQEIEKQQQQSHHGGASASGNGMPGGSDLVDPITMQQFCHSPPPSQPQHQQSQQPHSIQVNSPTPLAFTPTSVLRKMTAEKDNLGSAGSNSTGGDSSKNLNSSNVMQSILMSNVNAAVSVHQQHQSQPRMILGSGSAVQQQQNQHSQPPYGGTGGTAGMSGPSISPQTAALQQVMRNNQAKWNQMNLNQMKPMGRPILKGRPVSVPDQAPPMQSVIIPPAPQIPYGKNMDFHQQHQQTAAQQQLQQHQQHFQLLQHRQRIRAQQFQHIQYRQQILQKPSGSSAGTNQGPANMSINSVPDATSSASSNQNSQPVLHIVPSVVPGPTVPGPGNNTNSPTAAAAGVANSGNSSGIGINYQRDGGLSPTSNQLARWFSPELLAKASAGKLPSLNMGQALSLEEFERSIQHSSAAVHN